jgi:hypothetical protein
MDVVEQYAHLGLHPGVGVLLLFGDHGDEATEARSFGVASVPGYRRNCAQRDSRLPRPTPRALRATEVTPQQR